jgi:hypothetical protein
MISSLELLPRELKGSELYKFVSVMLDSVRSPVDDNVILNVDPLVLKLFKESNDLEAAVAYFNTLIKPIIGTRLCVENLIKMVSMDATVVEWFQTTFLGKPCKFQIYVETPPKDVDILTLIDLIMLIKNERSWLLSISMDSCVGRFVWDYTGWDYGMWSDLEGLSYRGVTICLVTNVYGHWDWRETNEVETYPTGISTLLYDRQGFNKSFREMWDYSKWDYWNPIPIGYPRAWVSKTTIGFSQTTRGWVGPWESYGPWGGWDYDLDNKIYIDAACRREMLIINREPWGIDTWQLDNWDWNWKVDPEKLNASGAWNDDFGRGPAGRVPWGEDQFLFEDLWSPEGVIAKGVWGEDKYGLGPTKGQETWDKDGWGHYGDRFDQELTHLDHFGVGPDGVWAWGNDDRYASRADWPLLVRSQDPWTKDNYGEGPRNREWWKDDIFNWDDKWSKNVRFNGHAKDHFGAPGIIIKPIPDQFALNDSFPKGTWDMDEGWDETQWDNLIGEYADDRFAPAWESWMGDRLAYTDKFSPETWKTGLWDHGSLDSMQYSTGDTSFTPWNDDAWGKAISILESWGKDKFSNFDGWFDGKWDSGFVAESDRLATDVMWRSQVPDEWGNGPAEYLQWVDHFAYNDIWSKDVNFVPVRSNTNPDTWGEVGIPSRVRWGRDYFRWYQWAERPVTCQWDSDKFGDGGHKTEIIQDKFAFGDTLARKEQWYIYSPDSWGESDLVTNWEQDTFGFGDHYVLGTWNDKLNGWDEGQWDNVTGQWAGDTFGISKHSYKPWKEDNFAFQDHFYHKEWSDSSYDKGTWDTYAYDTGNWAGIAWDDDQFAELLIDYDPWAGDQLAYGDRFFGTYVNNGVWDQELWDASQYSVGGLGKPIWGKDFWANPDSFYDDPWAGDTFAWKDKWEENKTSTGIWDSGTWDVDTYSGGGWSGRWTDDDWGQGPPHISDNWKRDEFAEEDKWMAETFGKGLWDLMSWDRDEYDSSVEQGYFWKNDHFGRGPDIPAKWEEDRFTWGDSFCHAEWSGGVWDFDEWDKFYWNAGSFNGDRWGKAITNIGPWGDDNFGAGTHHDGPWDNNVWSKGFIWDHVNYMWTDDFFGEAVLSAKNWGEADEWGLGPDAIIGWGDDHWEQGDKWASGLGSGMIVEWHPWYKDFFADDDTWASGRWDYGTWDENTSEWGGDCYGIGPVGYTATPVNPYTGDTDGLDTFQPDHIKKDIILPDGYACQDKFYYDSYSGDRWAALPDLCDWSDGVWDIFYAGDRFSGVDHFNPVIVDSWDVQFKGIRNNKVPPPVIPLPTNTPLGGTGDGAEVTKNQEITLETIPPESIIRYRFNDGSWLTYNPDSKPIIVEDCILTFKALSPDPTKYRDSEGEKSVAYITAKEVLVAPVMSFGNSAPNTTEIPEVDTIILEILEPQDILYRWDGGDWLTYSVPIQLLDNLGDHTLTYYTKSVDTTLYVDSEEINFSCTVFREVVSENIYRFTEFEEARSGDWTNPANAVDDGEDTYASIFVTKNTTSTNLIAKTSTYDDTGIGRISKIEVGIEAYREHSALTPVISVYSDSGLLTEKTFDQPISSSDPDVYVLTDVTSTISWTWNLVKQLRIEIGVSNTGTSDGRMYFDRIAIKVTSAVKET